MVEIKYNGAILRINPNDTNVGKLIFDRFKCSKTSKTMAKNYIVEFFISLINNNKIGISDYWKDYFYDTLECTNFKTTKTQYILDYKTGPWSIVGFTICNHFYTFININNKGIFADKKHIFDYFEINEIGCFGNGNFNITLKSNHFTYIIGKHDGVYNMSAIYYFNYCEDKFSDIFESLKFDLNRFIVDDKFIFNTDKLHDSYKYIIQTLLGNKTSEQYAKNVISEKLNILDFKINEILKEVKYNAKI